MFLLDKTLFISLFLSLVVKKSPALIAFLQAVGIGASVVWYLQYRSDVKTTITELSIEEFRNIGSGTE